MTSVDHQTGRLTTADGVELFYQRWLPPEPERLLLFVHGLAEHSGRYGNPVEYFSSRGCACWAVDLRGHGHSPGRRVHVDHFDDYALDVAALHRTARESYPQLPIILVGHSMGGLIALRYVLDTPDDLAGAILSSPGLAAHPSTEPSAALEFLAGILSRLAPRLLIASNIDSNAISHDREVVAAYRGDPLVTNKVSSRWYTSIVAAQAEVRQRALSLRRPLLVMQSGDDTLVSPEATQRWAEGASQDLVQFELWDGFYHEMFNEPERGEVFARMERWLAEEVPATV